VKTADFSGPVPQRAGGAFVPPLPGEDAGDPSFETLLDDTCGRLETTRRRLSLKRIRKLEAVLRSLERELDELLGGPDTVRPPVPDESVPNVSVPDESVPDVSVSAPGEFASRGEFPRGELPPAPDMFVPGESAPEGSGG
jgi:hypothetical protein